MKNKSIFTLLFGFVVALASSGLAEAQAIKPWGSIPAAQRFEVLPGYNNAAVLDRETGLVWQRTPVTNNNQPTTYDRSTALKTCLGVSINGHAGWRLPKVEEILSLEDPTVTSSPDNVRLPQGHPFLNVKVTGEAQAYWTSTVDPEFGSTFAVSVRVGTDHLGLLGLSANGPGGAWCVRGGAN